MLPMRPVTLKRLAWSCGLLLAVLLAVVLVALKLGAVPLSVSDLALNLGRVAIGRSAQLPSEYRLIIFELRLPRILLRIPLADPYVLGVSSGAALGAIVSLVAAPHLTMLGPLVTPAAAFLGAALTVAAVYLLGRRGGQLDSGTLLLAGIITASFLSAVIMFLMTTLSGRDLRGMAFWLMGDLSTPPPPSTLVRSVFVGGILIAVGAVYTTAADLNLLLTGEREAMHLGVQVTRVKLVVYIAASMLTGLAVSVSGAIGYV